MANFQFRPIYDTTANILDENTYPLIEGQVFFATDVNKLFVDVDGHRAAQTQLSSITNLGANISEVFQQGVKGFEGQILVGRSGTGYRLFYVDLNAVAHNLTFTAEKLGDLTERVAYQGGALSYAGNWNTGRLYTADRLRTSVVIFNGDYYYAVETHTSGATFAGDAAKWTKFSIQFESVATGLLLAENAVITKQLILGQEGTDQGTIRSANATAFNTGNGFFLTNANNGTLRVGNPSGSNLTWDGSSLSVTGAITATSGSFSGSISANTGTIGGWQITSAGLLKSPNVLLSALGFIDFAGTGFNPQGALISPKLRIDGRAVGAQKMIDTLSGKFSVTADGVLNATDGVFTGRIDVTQDSKISDILLEDRALWIYSGQGVPSFANRAAYFGFDRLEVGNNTSSQLTLNPFGLTITALVGSGSDFVINTGSNSLLRRVNSINRQIPGATISGSTLTIYLD